MTTDQRIYWHKERDDETLGSSAVDRALHCVL